MKTVLSLLVAVTFATPAFASAQVAKTVEAKNRKDIVTVVEAAQVKNAEEMRGEDAYRLKKLEDPNEKKVSENKKSWSVSPWLGDKRKRLLTPHEYRLEKEQGKNTTFIGSEVSKNYPKAYGAKVKVKFGARQ